MPFPDRADFADMLKGSLCYAVRLFSLFACKHFDVWLRFVTLSQRLVARFCVSCSHFCSTATAASLLRPSTFFSYFAMASAALASLPVDVLLRLHIFLGWQLAPVFARVAQCAAPSAILAHAEQQLWLLSQALMEPIPVPTMPTLLRQYGAVCKEAAAAVLARLAGLTEADLVWPGLHEAAPASLWRRCRGAPHGTTAAPLSKPSGARFWLGKPSTYRTILPLTWASRRSHWLHGRN